MAALLEMGRARPILSHRILPVDIHRHVSVALNVIARNDVPPGAADPRRSIDLIKQTRHVIRDSPFPNEGAPLGNYDCRFVTVG